MDDSTNHSLIHTLNNRTPTQIKLSFFQQEISAAKSLRDSLREMINEIKLKPTLPKRQRRKSVNSFNSQQGNQDQTENIIRAIQSVRKHIAREKQILEEDSFSCARNADANNSPFAFEFERVLAQKKYKCCGEDLEERSINCEQLVKQQQNLKKSGKIMQSRTIYSLKKVSKMKKVSLYLKKKAGAKEKLQRYLESLSDVKVKCEQMISQRESNPMARALFDCASFHVYRGVKSRLYGWQSAPILAKSKESVQFMVLAERIKKIDCNNAITSSLISEVLVDKLDVMRAKISSLARKNQILKQAIRIREEKRALRFIRHKQDIDLSLQEGAMKQILEHQEFSRSYPLNLSVAFDHYTYMSLSEFQDWKKSPQYLSRLREWPVEREIQCEELQRHQSCNSKKSVSRFCLGMKKNTKPRILSPLKNPNKSDPKTTQTGNEG